jgi:hypothetical protein
MKSSISSFSQVANARAVDSEKKIKRIDYLIKNYSTEKNIKTKKEIKYHLDSLTKNTITTATAYTWDSIKNDILTINQNILNTDTVAKQFYFLNDTLIKYYCYRQMGRVSVFLSEYYFDKGRPIYMREREGYFKPDSLLLESKSLLRKAKLFTESN